VSGAHYRARLNFTWEALDAASTALNRLRAACHGWSAPGEVDPDFLADFTREINDDLNMPRALALVWELVKSPLPDAVKKATLLKYDEVLGLRLAEWEPAEVSIPAEILSLAQQREAARAARRWQEADALREQIKAAGYTVEDTPQGPRLRPAA